MTTIGIIGGSGVYSLEGLSSVEELRVTTPFGPPSDTLIKGELGGVQLYFVPRHGKGHLLLPSEVPYRANVFALKQLGVQWLISVSAVGSMKEEIVPGHFVIPDQFIDRTQGRAQTFFGEGVAAHVSMAEPTCPTLRQLLAGAVEAAGVHCHTRGTYICMEGPAFSSRAESFSYRALDVSVIGMTAMPEAKLAREAELHYATIALATDYDCWHQEEEAVSASAVVEILRQNTANVKEVLAGVVPAVAQAAGSECGCTKALAGGIMTPPELIPVERKKALAPLLEKYL